MKIKYQSHNFTQAKLKLISVADAIIREYTADSLQLTMRQLYYQFVARDIIENTQKSYKNLVNLMTNARVAGLISWYALEDRNRELSEPYVQEDIQDIVSGIEYHYSLDMWRDQDTHVEVWIEKDALINVIEKPCDRFRVPHMACKGYLSSTMAWNAGQRYRDADRAGKHCVLIHLGDHDPSGIDMTRDNDARLLMFSHGVDIEVKRIALNMDQVEQYGPPPNPAKITDTRVSAYINKYGNTSWELDALEPKVISNLVEAEIKKYIDFDIWDRQAREQAAGREKLRRIGDNWNEVSKFLEGLE